MSKNGFCLAYSPINGVEWFFGIIRYVSERLKQGYITEKQAASEIHTLEMMAHHKGILPVGRNRNATDAAP